MPEDYDGISFCGMAEPVAAGELRRDPSALWYLEAGLSSLSRDQVRLAVKWAFDQWSQVANVHADEAKSADEAHLLIRVPSRIDGPQGVLADCVLPGPPVQLMRLDPAEKWVLTLGEDVPGNVIDLFRVVCHELGHFWGLGHAPQGSANLMAPIYSRTIWQPTGSWEIDQMVQVYGKPSTKPPPGQNRTPSVITIFDQYNEVLASYELGKRLA